MSVDLLFELLPFAFTKGAKNALGPTSDAMKKYNAANPEKAKATDAIVESVIKKVNAAASYATEKNIEENRKEKEE